MQKRHDERLRQGGGDDGRPDQDLLQAAYQLMRADRAAGLPPGYKGNTLIIGLDHVVVIEEADRESCLLLLLQSFLTDTDNCQPGREHETFL